MKLHLLFLAMLTCFASMQAQGDCQRMLKDAHTAHKKGDFITAIYCYNAARKCNPDIEREASKQIVSIFEKLESLIAKAESERRRAEENERQATQAKDETEKIKQQIQRSDRVARNAVSAMKAARKDPAIGLRMAQYLRDKYPDLSISSAVFNDIFLKTDQFYQKHYAILNRGDHATSLAWSPDGKHLLIGTGQGQAIMMDAEGKKEKKLFGEASQDDCSAIFLHEGRQVLILKDGVAQVREVDTGYEVQSFLSVSDAAISDDGRKLALADQYAGKISVYDITQVPFLLLKEFTTEKSNLKRVAVSKDSIITVAASYGKGYLLLMNNQGLVEDWKAHEDDIWSVCFSPVSKLILTASDDNIVKLWNFEKQEQATMIGHNNDVYWATFSKDGRWVFSSSEDRTVRMWDIKGTRTGTFQGHTSDVMAVSCSPVSNQVASIDGQGNLMIWKPNHLLPLFNSQATKTYKHGKKLPLPEEGNNDVFRYAICPYDGSILACYDRKIQITSLYSDRNETIDVRQSEARSFAYPDTATVLTGHRDGHIFRYKRTVTSTHTTGTATLRKTEWLVADSLKTHRGLVSSIAYAPDGRSFATGGWDARAYIWDTQNFRPTDTLYGHTDRIHSIAVSQKGHILAGSEDGTAILWDANGNRLFTLSGHNKPILSVAFSPDGNLCITGSADKTARIWKVHDGSLFSILQNIHEEQISAVAFAPDSNTILTGSVDNSLVIWTLDGEAIIRLTGHPTDIANVTYTPDGNILSMDRYGQINAWYTIKNFVQDQVAKVPLLALVNQGLELSDRELQESHDAEVYIAVADVQSSKKQWAEAYSLYQQAFALKPSLAATLGQYRSSSHLSNTTFDFSRILSDAGPSTWYAFAQVLFDEKKHLEEATAMLEKAELLQHHQDQLLLLERIVSYQQKSLDFSRFLNSNDSEELGKYGDYFSNRGAMAKTVLLYQKSDSIEHTPKRRLKVQVAMGALGKTLPLETFLSATESAELNEYGSHFYGRSNWKYAWPLYEKAFRLQYEGKTLLQMQRIAERTGRNVDFDLFLQAEKPIDLNDFSRYFRSKARELELQIERLKEKKGGIPAFSNRLMHILWDRVRQIQERLYQMQPGSTNLINWYSAAIKVADKGVKIPTKEQFTTSDNSYELLQYGQFFLKEENWAYAEELFLKCLKKDTSNRNPECIIGLYKVYRQDRKKSNLAKNYFLEMLTSTNPSELLRYATAVRPTEEMTRQKMSSPEYYEQAKSLENKAFALDPVGAVQRKKDLSTTYNSLGWYQLFIPDSIGTGPEGCELSIRRGIELDPTNLYLYTNLPTAYLLQNRWREAEEIYLERKDQTYMPNRNLPTFKDVFLQDMKDLEEGGITHPGFDCMRQVLERGIKLPYDSPCKKTASKRK